MKPFPRFWQNSHMILLCVEKQKWMRFAHDDYYNLQNVRFLIYSQRRKRRCYKWSIFFHLRTYDASFASRQKFLVFCMCNKAVRVSYHPFWLTSIGYKKSARDYIELPFGIWISKLYLWTVNMTPNYQFSRQKLVIFYL